MLPLKVPQLTIPLFPLLHPGEQKPRLLKRIRPEDALDLQYMVKELEPSNLVTLKISGRPWSVVSVYSPYSPDIHVMTIETSSDRYLPGPESVPDEEGNSLTEVWVSIIDFITKRKANATICIGYNWSPRSWGIEEEKGGFQSVPTKWHTMIWGWPPFPENDQTTEYIKYVESSTLSPEAKRIMGNNKYAEPFGQLVERKFQKAFHNNTVFNKLFPPQNWKSDSRGICVTFSRSIQEILRIPEFFSQVLKPVAKELEFIMRELTESMTTLKCSDMEKILIKTENKRISKHDLQTLRAAPDMNSPEEIKKVFQERNYPESFLEEILEPVQNRCIERGEPSNWWRKGFGYALVLSSSSNGSSGALRIIPGVFIGPGGVVEAQRVILRRPLDKHVSEIEIKEKSEILWRLADSLKSRFREY